jgi:hypothetical protein
MMEDSELSQDTGSMAESILSEPSQPREYDTPPTSWKKEVAERHWSRLDPDLRGYVHSREKEAGDKISQQGHRLRELEATAQRVAELEATAKRVSELEGVSYRYQPIESVFDRYRQHIPENLMPAEAIEQLLVAQQMLSAPETRQQAIEFLLQSYGVDPMALLPAEMRQQIETARREVTSHKEAQSLKEFEEFAKGKDYVQGIMPDIAAEMRTLRQQGPGLDGKTLLRLAHDNVIERTGIKARLDEQAKAEAEGRTAQAAYERLKEMQEQEAKRREENDRRVKAAMRAASINVKSSPAQRIGPKTLDEDLRAIAYRAYSK